MEIFPTFHHDKPSKLVKTQKSLECERLKLDMQTRCCLKQCCLHHIDLIMKRRNELWQCNEDDKCSMVLKYLALCGHDTSGNIVYEMENVECCRIFFCKCFNISPKKLTKCLIRLHNPEINQFFKATRFQCSNDQTHVFEIVKWFMQNFQGSICNPGPLEDQIIMIPLYGEKRLVFEWYESDCRESGRVPCSDTYFFWVWKNLLPQFKMHRSNSLPRCMTCLGFGRKIQECLKSQKQIKESLEKAWRAHILNINKRLRFNDNRLNFKESGRCMTLEDQS